jgi:hypothetical protein
MCASEMTAGPGVQAGYTGGKRDGEAAAVGVLAGSGRGWSGRWDTATGNKVNPAHPKRCPDSMRLAFCSAWRFGGFLRA